MSSSASPSKSSMDQTAYLPAVWQDDERMGALMSQFRARETNPDAYDGKMRFWSDLIEV